MASQVRLLAAWGDVNQRWVVIHSNCGRDCAYYSAVGYCWYLQLQPRVESIYLLVDLDNRYYFVRVQISKLHTCKRENLRSAINEVALYKLCTELGSCEWRKGCKVSCRYLNLNKNVFPKGCHDLNLESVARTDLDKWTLVGYWLVLQYLSEQ